MKKIYIVLSQNYTVLSRIIKNITKNKYSHISISFNKECTDMYSIGRTYKRWPFSGCYKNENIGKGVFTLNKNSEIAIYELEVSESKYSNIRKLLNEYGSKAKGYNLLGLIFALFNKKLDRKKYYCSEFIYKILSDDSVKIFPKTENIVKPMDFLKMKNLNKIYEGNIIKYKDMNIYEKIMI